MKIFKRRMVALFLAACLMIQMAASTNATTTTTTQTAPSQKIVTKRSTLPKTTTMDKLQIRINSASGTYRSYRIYHQKAKTFKKTSFMFVHGCATSCLTTILSAYSPDYFYYTPTQTYQSLERQVLGEQIWSANYNKKGSKRRPLSMYGVSTILTKLGIKNTYVPKFKNAEAVQTIKNHLYGGNPVVIEVNCNKQKDGKFSYRYTSRWTFSKHSMVLLGMTEDGKAIIADSSDRTWSGKNQRLKYAKVEELVQYMIPCKRIKNYIYYKHIDVSGGFVLVNP